MVGAAPGREGQQRHPRRRRSGTARALRREDRDLRQLPRGRVGVHAAVGEDQQRRRPPAPARGVTISMNDDMRGHAVAHADAAQGGAQGLRGRWSGRPRPCRRSGRPRPGARPTAAGSARCSRASAAVTPRRRDVLRGRRAGRASTSRPSRRHGRDRRRRAKSVPVSRARARTSLAAAQQRDPRDARGAPPAPPAWTVRGSVPSGRTMCFRASRARRCEPPRKSMDGTTRR